MVPLSQVPAVRAAIEEENETRDAAFLGAACEIAGVAVLPLTLRRYLLLCASGNAFVTSGRPVTPEQVAQFLWCVSADYNPDKRGLGEFVARVGDQNYGTTLEAIGAYLAFALFDAPRDDGESKDGPAKEPPPLYYSAAAVYVDILGAEYGWTFDDCLDVPLSVIFQLLKRIEHRKDARALLFNPLSDRAKAEYAAGLTA